jgi:intracellular sulfur oxidation DsrE/DsrF family protein
MKNLARMLAVAAALAAGMMFAAPGQAAENVKTHKIAIQVDQNNPALMNLVLNNVANVLAYYHSKGEQAEVEVVAYGPGLMMLREDKSPVKARLKSIKDGAFPSKLTYSACHNTMKGMEKKEGHAIQIVPEARVVPAGVVRLTELQEQGWSYIRP